MSSSSENEIKNEGMGKEIYLPLENEFHPEQGIGEMLFEELKLHGDEIAQVIFSSYLFNNIKSSYYW